MLFSDIRGFSSIAERLSAREIADVVGRHLQAMAEVVADHGGTIDKFQGDAVMALFGAPDPLTDHAERGLRCAIAMQARQRDLNAMGWGTDAVAELGVGIGLNSGIVVAGAIGGGGRLEYTVIGDAVNVAQRLQSEAAAGEIVAAAATVIAAPSIPAERIGTRPVKGRNESVEVYRIGLDETPEAGPTPPETRSQTWAETYLRLGAESAGPAPAVFAAIELSPDSCCSSPRRTGSTRSRWCRRRARAHFELAAERGQTVGHIGLSGSTRRSCRGRTPGRRPPPRIPAPRWCR